MGAMFKMACHGFAGAALQLLACLPFAVGVFSFRLHVALQLASQRVGRDGLAC